MLIITTNVSKSGAEKSKTHFKFATLFFPPCFRDNSTRSIFLLCHNSRTASTPFATVRSLRLFYAVYNAAATDGIHKLKSIGNNKANVPQAHFPTRYLGTAIVYVTIPTPSIHAHCKTPRRRDTIQYYNTNRP